jgi:hypothetical protein
VGVALAQTFAGLWAVAVVFVQIFCVEVGCCDRYKPIGVPMPQRMVEVGVYEKAITHGFQPKLAKCQNPLEIKVCRIFLS